MAEPSGFDAAELYIREDESAHSSSVDRSGVSAHTVFAWSAVLGLSAVVATTVATFGLWEKHRSDAYAVIIGGLTMVGLIILSAELLDSRVTRSLCAVLTIAVAIVVGVEFYIPQKVPAIAAKPAPLPAVQRTAEQALAANGFHACRVVAADQQAQMIACQATAKFDHVAAWWFANTKIAVRFYKHGTKGWEHEKEPPSTALSWSYKNLAHPEFAYRYEGVVIFGRWRPKN